MISPIYKRYPVRITLFSTLKRYCELNLLPILILFLVPFLFSCNVQKIGVSDIQSAKIVKFDKTGVEAEAKIKISNPNKFKVKVVKTNLILSVNQVPVGKAKLQEKVIILPRSEESYVFKVHTNLASLMMGGLSGLQGKLNGGKVDVALKGHIKVRVWGFPRKIPVDIMNKMPVPKNLPTGL